MIVYRELASLVHDLGYSAKALYSVSRNVHMHYRAVQIPKRSGGTRQLHIPDPFLKGIQRRILQTLLWMEEISPYAQAYRPGASTAGNARAHVGKPVLLKLDIRDFFDRLIFPLVKDRAFPASRYSEQNRVLLTSLCIYIHALPQGAPTSPAISNIIMRDFDNRVGSWAAQRGIAYTRYCDDMSFSGDFDPRPVIAMVREELGRMGLYLNEQKTTVARRGQRQEVTGIVVNEKPGVPRQYKDRLRRDMYYCMKYGIESHLQATGENASPEEYRLRLLGRVNYVLHIEPDHARMRAYRSWLTAQK